MTIKQYKKYEYIFIGTMVAIATGIILYVWTHVENSFTPLPAVLWWGMGVAILCGLFGLYFQGKWTSLDEIEIAKTAKLGEVICKTNLFNTNGDYSKALSWEDVGALANIKNKGHVVTKIEIFQHEIKVYFAMIRK